MIVGVVGCGEIGSVDTVIVGGKERGSAADCAASRLAVVSAVTASGLAEPAVNSGSGWAGSDKAGSVNGAAVNCGIGWPWPTDSSGAASSSPRGARSAMAGLRSFLSLFQIRHRARWFRQWLAAFQSPSKLPNQSQGRKVPRRPAKLPPNRVAERFRKRPPAPLKLSLLRAWQVQNKTERQEQFPRLLPSLSRGCR